MLSSIRVLVLVKLQSKHTTSTSTASNSTYRVGTRPSYTCMQDIELGHGCHSARSKTDCCVIKRRCCHSA
eukprot:scaffold592902_cov20-Prasinocladus_malaysianus.AAC.1